MSTTYWLNVYVRRRQTPRRWPAIRAHRDHFGVATLVLSFGLTTRIFRGGRRQEKTVHTLLRERRYGRR